MTAFTDRPPGAGVAPLGRPVAYAAELIGTFGLVLFIVLVLTDSAAPPLGLGGPDFAVVGLLAGTVVAATLYTVLVISPQPKTADDEVAPAGQPASPAPAPSGQLGVAR